MKMCMTIEQIIADAINKKIDQLPAARKEAVRELSEFLRMNIKRAGSPVGELAIALVGAEMQLANA